MASVPASDSHIMMSHCMSVRLLPLHGGANIGLQFRVYSCVIIY